MYKIYFDDRLFVLTDDFEACFSQTNVVACKLSSKEQMTSLVAYFETASQTPALWVYHSNLKKAFNWFCSNFKIIEAAGGLVKNKNNDYLLIFRFNHWDLPKGKCEKKETPEETALREVEEECGLSNLNLYNHLVNTYHVYTHKDKLSLKKTYWYSMHYNGSAVPVPQTEEGIDRVEWVDETKLQECFITMYKSIKDVFANTK